MLVDRGGADLTSCYLENTRVAVHAVASAFVSVLSSTFGNAGGTPTSQASGRPGAIVLNDNSTVTYGFNRIAGMTDQSYVTTPGNQAAGWIRAGNDFAIFDLGSLPSDTAHYVTASDGPLDVGAYEMIIVAGGTADRPVVISDISGKHNPGSTVEVVSKGYLTFASSATGGAAFTIGPDQTATAKRIAFRYGPDWSIIATATMPAPVAATLQNGWVDYGNGSRTTRFFISRDRRVTIEGFVRMNSGPAS